MSSNNNELNYLFASGHLKAKENRLMNESAQDKLIEATSNEDAIKILSAQGYTIGANMADKKHFYDEVMESARIELYTQLAEIAPDIEHFNFFLYPYDYLNIKALLKGRTMDNKREIVSNAGSIPYKTVRRAVEEKSYDALTSNMSAGITEALEAYASKQDTQLIDIVLDKRCYADMIEAATKSGSTFLVDYVRMLIDVTNIKTFMRLRKMHKSLNFAAYVFSAGGSISVDTFLNSYHLKLEEIAISFQGSQFSELVKEGLTLVNTAGGMGIFELKCENHIMRFVKKARYIAFGPEVVAGYILAKETEFKNIRIIMAGKSVQLPGGKIKERLRETYA